jgi:hypothetical protein
VVLAARELEPVAAQLRASLGLGEPFADPGVAEFGLRNAVFALGDCFVEVIAPAGGESPAGRWLDRRGGDGGYMLIFQLDDLEAGRARAAALGVRVVWSVDLPDISGTHLHPADMRGAIVSLDRADPPGSWRWGGPEWTGQAGPPAPGRLLGVQVAVADPEATASRWAQVLGVPADGPRLEYAGGAVEFSPADADAIAAVRVALPAAVRGGRPGERIGGVHFQFEDEEPG